jgi:hypothetical protein
MDIEYFPFFSDEKYDKRKSMMLQGVALYQKWLGQFLRDRDESRFLSLGPSVEALARDFVDLGMGGFASRLRNLIKGQEGVLEQKAKTIEVFSILQCLCFAILNYEKIKKPLYEEALNLAGLNLYQSELELRKGMVSPAVCVEQEEGIEERIAWRKEWYYLEISESLCYSYSTAFQFFQEPMKPRIGERVTLSFVPYPGWACGSSRIHILAHQPFELKKLLGQRCLQSSGALETKWAQVFSQRPWIEDCRFVVAGIEFIKDGAQIYVKANHHAVFPIGGLRSLEIDPSLTPVQSLDNAYWEVRFRESTIRWEPFLYL